MAGTREIDVAIIQDELLPTGCWSDFNQRYKIRRSLWIAAGREEFIHKEEVPEIPDIDNYSDLGC